MTWFGLAPMAWRIASSFLRLVRTNDRKTNAEATEARDATTN